MYTNMPFGLINIEETFQHVMDIDFSKEKDKILVIYLDDITVCFQSPMRSMWHIC